MSDPVRTIVAGVSHASEDDPTLAPAAELARWTGAEPHPVHAFGLPPVVTPPEIGYVDPAWARRCEDTRRGLLVAAAQRAGAGAAVCHTVAGPPASALLDVATQLRADLVVVGAARAARLAVAFLGTTAQRVLREAAVPVLVVRGPVHRPLERLLLTTDLSERSAPAHEEALDAVASVFGAPGAARSLLVVSFPILPPPRDALDRAARAELDAFLAARRLRSGAVSRWCAWSTPGTRSRPRRKRGRSTCRAARLVLGSVAEGAA